VLPNQVPFLVLISKPLYEVDSKKSLFGCTVMTMNSTTKKFLKGQLVKILPEFQDDGDDEFTWVVVNDEEKGRVDISAIDSPLTIKPIHTVQTDWLELS
jgi:hypothetical protein